jgi:DNA-binding CsgD family transcriptional regulator
MSMAFEPVREPVREPLHPGHPRAPLSAMVPHLRSFRYQPRAIRFSPVQALVVQLVCCGLADKEIAFLLGVCAATVKAHMSRAIRDMGLHRRHQLVRYVFENGLFDPEWAEAEIVTRRSRMPLPEHDQ